MRSWTWKNENPQIFLLWQWVLERSLGSSFRWFFLKVFFCWSEKKGNSVCLSVKVLVRATSRHQSDFPRGEGPIAANPWDLTLHTLLHLSPNARKLSSVPSWGLWGSREKIPPPPPPSRFVESEKGPVVVSWPSFHIQDSISCMIDIHRLLCWLLRHLLSRPEMPIV